MRLFLRCTGKAWYCYLIRSELRTARELGEHLLTLAQQVGDPVLRVEAHYALGLTLNYLGEFAAAQTHLAQGMALYDPQHHRVHAFGYGQDAGVACRAYGAANLWWLGYPDQALQWSHEAVTLARELAHPFSLQTGPTDCLHQCGMKPIVFDRCKSFNINTCPLTC